MVGLAFSSPSSNNSDNLPTTTIMQTFLRVVEDCALQNAGTLPFPQKPEGIGAGGPIWACLFDDSVGAAASVEGAVSKPALATPVTASADDSIQRRSAASAVPR